MAIEKRLLPFLFAFYLCLPGNLCAGEKPASAPRPLPKDPVKSAYQKYVPNFPLYDAKRRGAPTKKMMKLSSEPSFYTLNLLNESARAAALVKAGMEKEAAGDYRTALEMYQQVIDKYPDTLHRVCKYGVFVPISQYCQRRILLFPKEELAFYRTKYDARAKEAFDQARRKYSLEGLAEIRDTMLATSYGGRTMLMLGDTALDRGHFLEALEYFSTVRDSFPDPALHTPELALKIEYCKKMLGGKSGKPTTSPGKSALPEAALQRFKKELAAAGKSGPPARSQSASAPHASSDDYTLFPPSNDWEGIQQPVWQQLLPGSRNDFFSYTQPVTTQNSVIYRHKNIVYSRSLLTGELRWKNDLGGRVTWQNRGMRQYPQEGLLIQDGLVIAPMYKVGPTLVALDQITGQLKWAYGPMVASTRDQARMRFETAPAGGPRSVYAGYVLDNIDGETHTDTEYGVIAFESTTGRVLWRRTVCRMLPGKFAGGFATRHRNRIRSFVSPPLYHQGTVYYCTNAGAISALDALSGRVKWTMRYPYYAHPRNVHDATRGFGGLGRYESNPLRHHRFMFWYNQRPLLIGEDLYVLPVDTPYMLKIDRRTGKVHWSKHKGGDGAVHFMGANAKGELVMAYSVRKNGGVHLLDPKTGNTLWRSGDPIGPMKHPAMNYYFYFGSGRFMGAGFPGWDYQLAARPYLSSDGTICMTSFRYWAWPIYGWSSNLYHVSLSDRKVLGRRRYISGEILSRAAYDIKQGASLLKGLLALPHKNKKVQSQIKAYKAISEDTVPVNQHGPFLPFSRLLVRRHGVLFELRTGPRQVAMVYDRAALRKNLADRNDPDGLFARAELAMADSRLSEASALMKKALEKLSSEDVDFRAAVNQQLYQVHKRLARSGIRAGNREREMDNCLGMRRTVGTLPEEIETFFALGEAFERRQDHSKAAQRLQNAIGTYGHYEYPTSSLLIRSPGRLMTACQETIKRGQAFAGKTMYGREWTASMALMEKGLSLYFSALSPLNKDLTVRTGELASSRLARLLKSSPEFAAQFETAARVAIGKAAPPEQLSRLWEFPATKTAQEVINSLLAAAREELADGSTELGRQAELRRQMWGLADAARICGLKLPEAYRDKLMAPPKAPEDRAPAAPLKDRVSDLAETRDPAWLILERRGQRHVQPDRLFLGGRVRKKLDNKFILYCMDLATGKRTWKAQEKRGEAWFDEIRLKGKGDEAGFKEAFIHKDLVIVHGRYDVLAFALQDGKLRWRYRVPFAFEIKHAMISGDLIALSGQGETVMLYASTKDPRGEVAWRQKEEGDLYAKPYFHRDLLVSVRKMPFNLTVRFRATGKLIGRLALPDLSLHQAHPLVTNGPRALPVAHDEERLVVTDGWYYIMLDVERMKVMWKRLIDENDVTRDPPMRFELKGDYLGVLRQNYDVKTIYMLSSRTGQVLWRTDPKNAKSPQPIHSMVIRNDKLYGIQPHPGQGFYFVGRDCKTGRDLFRRNEQKGYAARPNVRLRSVPSGNVLVALVRDRQNFELKAFDLAKGKLLHKTALKATGDFGQHGRASATVQNGKLTLFGGNKLKAALESSSKK